jgi:hypothetical protein
MHGTNDQGSSRTPEQFRADIVTIINRVRAARPTCDILLIAPCENQRVNSVAMADYAAQMLDIAVQSSNIAFLNLQSYFGTEPLEYSSTSARPWFNVDGIHPEPEFGGYAMTDAILKAIGEA